MVIWPAFRMGQYRANDHPYHAPQFIDMLMKSWEWLFLSDYPYFSETHEISEPALCVISVWSL